MKVEQENTPPPRAKIATQNTLHTFLSCEIHELAVKATDSGYRSMPEALADDYR